MMNGEWDETFRRKRIILNFANMTRKYGNIWRMCKTGFCIWCLLEDYWIKMSIEHFFYFLLFYGTTAPNGPVSAHCQGFTITLRHTPLGCTPLDEGSSRRRDLHLTTDNTHGRHPCPGKIWTRNPNKRTAAHSHLRPRLRPNKRNKSLTRLSFVYLRF